MTGLVVGRAATDKWLLAALSLLFLLSGVSGLIYQALWLRQLALVFGVTIYAASTVLAAFMAGLALGSLASGRLVDRSRNALLWYALAEVLIGLSALATPLALRVVERLYDSVYGALGSGLAPLTLARFFFSFAVLIVPTTLMGATLPMIIKSSLFGAGGVGERAGLLYASNTAGAILGTLLAGFYLIGRFGLFASFQMAAALNVAVGLSAAAMWAFNRRRETVVPAESSPAISGAAEAAAPPRARRLVLAVFALSGFTSLALEVIWFRLLILYFEVTTYAFTVMLATVLCGIAVGSYVITPLMRRRLDWLAALGAIEMAIGVASLMSIAGLAQTSGVLSWVGPQVSAVVGGFSLMVVASFLAIFPATLLMGVAFPIGLRLWAADGSARAGERIGLFYSLNVFGAIAGSIAAGFILLPALGSRASLLAVAAISLASGLALLSALPRKRRALTFGAIGVALFIMAAANMPDPFAIVLAHRYPGNRLLWREDGAQTTVSVQQHEKGRRVMYLDGVHQAEDNDDTVRIHRQIGCLPVALHPGPVDALVIGLGGGVTAGAVSRMPGINLDVVELSETVVRASEWFSHVNYDVMRRPNVRLRIDDGRNYLRLTTKRYDVITADIIRPFHAGAGNLYSAEYFRLARNALRDDGLMLQWTGSWSERQYKLVVRTFLSVFPETTLWVKGNLMVGSKQPLLLDEGDFRRKLEDAGMLEALRSIGIDSFQSLLKQYTTGPQELRDFVGPGPILTDDRPMIEYFLSLGESDRKVDTSQLRGDVMRHVRR